MLPIPVGSMVGGLVSPISVRPASVGCDEGAEDKSPPRLPPVDFAVGAAV